MDIILARKADVVAVSQIYSDSHDAKKEDAFSTGWSRKVFPTTLTAYGALTRNELYIGVENGKIIGTVILTTEMKRDYEKANWKYHAEKGEYMMFYALTIDRKHYRKGYGSEIVRYVENFVKSKGCKYMRTSVNERNTGAREFLRHMGYEETEMAYINVEEEKDIKTIIFEKIL